jgi:ABC-2 type transport system ATP-binding protein
MLATLLRPDGGSARVFGHDVRREPTAVRSLIGVTGQYATIDEKLSATENLTVFCRLLGLSRAETKLRTKELLAEFDLTEAADKALKNFSGGMRRRLDLAAGLIHNPPLLFLDEPTTGLDPRTRAQMWDTIRQLVARGTTALLTTQYLDEADQLADRIAVIDHGKVIADGTSDELKAAVGVSSLELTVADPADLPAARRLVGELLRRGEPTVSLEARSIAAPLADAGLAGDILIRLRDENIRIDAVNVAKPSLDEVFFALTGHAAEDDDKDRSAA